MQVALREEAFIILAALLCGQGKVVCIPAVCLQALACLMKSGHSNTPAVQARSVTQVNSMRFHAHAL